MKFSTWLNGLTSDSSPIGSTDYVATYDASATTSKKVLIDDLLTSSGGIAESGWVSSGETWTYASADDPTYTFTIAGVDLTSKYSAGMRIRLSQATGGTKYFIITKVAFSTDTTITIYGGTDYDLVNEAISSPNYSTVKAPAGFPLDPTKWSVETTDTTNRSVSNPVNGTVYNVASLGITVPIGAWNIQIRFNMEARRATGGQVIVKYGALETANNTLTAGPYGGYITAFGDVDANPLHSISNVVTINEPLVLSTKSARYFNWGTITTNMTLLTLYNSICTASVRAVCAYL